MMERHAVEIIYAVAVFPLPGEVIQMLSNAIQYSCCDKYNNVHTSKYIVDNDFIFVYNLN